MMSRFIRVEACVPVESFQEHLAHKNPPPQDPIVGLCLGTLP